MGCETEMVIRSISCAVLHYSIRALPYKESAAVIVKGMEAFVSRLIVSLPPSEVEATIVWAEKTVISVVIHQPSQPMMGGEGEGQVEHMEKTQDLIITSS